MTSGKFSLISTLSLVFIMSFVFLACSDEPDGAEGEVYVSFEWGTLPARFYVDDPVIPGQIIEKVYYKTKPGTYTVKYWYDSIFVSNVIEEQYVITANPGEKGGPLAPGEDGKPKWYDVHLNMYGGSVYDWSFNYNNPGTALLKNEFFTDSDGAEGEVYVSFQWTTLPAKFYVDDPLIPGQIVERVYYKTQPGTYTVKYWYDNLFHPEVNVEQYVITANPGTVIDGKPKWCDVHLNMYGGSFYSWDFEYQNTGMALLKNENFEQ